MASAHPSSHAYQDAVVVPPQQYHMYYGPSYKTGRGNKYQPQKLPSKLQKLSPHVHPSLLQKQVHPRSQTVQPLNRNQMPYPNSKLMNIQGAWGDSSSAVQHDRGVPDHKLSRDLMEVGDTLTSFGPANSVDPTSKAQVIYGEGVQPSREMRDLDGQLLNPPIGTLFTPLDPAHAADMEVKVTSSNNERLPRYETPPNEKARQPANEVTNPTIENGAEDTFAKQTIRTIIQDPKTMMAHHDPTVHTEEGNPSNDTLGDVLPANVAAISDPRQEFGQIQIVNKEPSLRADDPNKVKKVIPIQNFEGPPGLNRYTNDPSATTGPSSNFVKIFEKGDYAVDASQNQTDPSNSFSFAHISNNHQGWLQAMSNQRSNIGKKPTLKNKFINKRKNYQNHNQLVYQNAYTNQFDHRPSAGANQGGNTLFELNLASSNSKSQLGHGGQFPLRIQSQQRKSNSVVRSSAKVSPFYGNFKLKEQQRYHNNLPGVAANQYGNNQPLPSQPVDDDGSMLSIVAGVGNNLAPEEEYRTRDEKSAPSGNDLLMENSIDREKNRRFVQTLNEGENFQKVPSSIGQELKPFGQKQQQRAIQQIYQQRAFMYKRNQVKTSPNKRENLIKPLGPNKGQGPNIVSAKVVSGQKVNPQGLQNPSSFPEEGIQSLSNQKQTVSHLYNQLKHHQLQGKQLEFQQLATLKNQLLNSNPTTVPPSSTLAADGTVSGGGSLAINHVPNGPSSTLAVSNAYPKNIQARISTVQSKKSNSTFRKGSDQHPQFLTSKTSNNQGGGQVQLPMLNSNMQKMKMNLRAKQQTTIKHQAKTGRLMGKEDEKALYQAHTEIKQAKLVIDAKRSVSQQRGSLMAQNRDLSYGQMQNRELKPPITKGNTKLRHLAQPEPPSAESLDVVQGNFSHTVASNTNPNRDIFTPIRSDFASSDFGSKQNPHSLDPSVKGRQQVVVPQFAAGKPYKESQSSQLRSISNNTKSVNLSRHSKKKADDPNNQFTLGQIEASLRRIDDKFSRLNDNLQKYSDMMRPAKEQLATARAFGSNGTDKLASLNQLITMREQSMNEGLSQGDTQEFKMPQQQVTGAYAVTQNQIEFSAPLTHTSRGGDRFYNLDDTIPDISQTDCNSQAQKTNRSGKSTERISILAPRQTKLTMLNTEQIDEEEKQDQ